MVDEVIEFELIMRMLLPGIVVLYIRRYTVSYAINRMLLRPCECASECLLSGGAVRLHE